jgi:hypothetical protein
MRRRYPANHRPLIGGTVTIYIPIQMTERNRSGKLKTVESEIPIVGQYVGSVGERPVAFVLPAEEEHT